MPKSSVVSIIVVACGMRNLCFHVGDAGVFEKTFRARGMMVELVRCVALGRLVDCYHETSKQSLYRIRV